MTGGDRYERELVNSLTAAGYPAVRIPTSGSATDRDLPDVLAGSAHVISGSSGPLKTLSDCYAIELKTTSRTTAYADADEVRDVGAFAQAFGASPIIAARFKRKGSRTPYYLVPPPECRETDGGAYGVPESDAEDRAELVVWPETDANDAEVVRV